VLRKLGRAEMRLWNDKMILFAMVLVSYFEKYKGKVLGCGFGAVDYN